MIKLDVGVYFDPETREAAFDAIEVFTHVRRLPLGSDVNAESVRKVVIRAGDEETEQPNKLLIEGRSKPVNYTGNET